MTTKKEQYIESLECLYEGMLPVEIQKLKSAQIAAVSELVDDILAKERAGLDKFFGSMSQTLKYIPNFLILAITHKYIDPPIAARITESLPLKQAVSIAKGLPAAYVGKAAVYMDNESAASLLFALPKKNIIAIMDAMFDSHVLKVLDIFAYASDKAYKLVKPPQQVLFMGDENLNEARLKVLNKFRK